MFRKSTKFLFFIIIILLFSSFTYAYAAANIVPETKAGDGTGTVSGYTISSVVYDLNSSNPTLIDGITFTLNAPANLVKIRLVSTGSTWYSCTGTTMITCLTTSPQATVLATNTLQVIAAGN